MSLLASVESSNLGQLTSHHGVGEEEEMPFPESLFCLPLLVPPRNETSWPVVLLINLTSGCNPGVLPNKTAYSNMHISG